jgi:hypothetical protein
MTFKFCPHGGQDNSAARVLLATRSSSCSGYCSYSFVAKELLLLRTQGLEYCTRVLEKGVLRVLRTR